MVLPFRFTGGEGIVSFFCLSLALKSVDSEPLTIIDLWERIMQQRCQSFIAVFYSIQLIVQNFNQLKSAPLLCHNPA